MAEKASSHYPFGIDDFFQQVMGSAILTAPFLFTEEVWMLADNMSNTQATLTAVFTLVIGHGVLYVAHQERDWKEERKVLGITWRYVSLMLVAFGTVALLLSLTAAVETFNAGPHQTAKTVALMSVFAVVGAATADNLI